jgi:hypothetical protein
MLKAFLKKLHGLKHLQLLQQDERQQSQQYLLVVVQHMKMHTAIASLHVLHLALTTLISVHAFLLMKNVNSLQHE